MKNGRIYGEAEGENKQWLAIITGSHPCFGYKRKWVAYRKLLAERRASGSRRIKEGDILEEVRFSHNGNSRTEQYYQVKDGELKELSGIEEVDAILDARE